MSNPTVADMALGADEKAKSDLGSRGVNLITESGLYKLISRDVADYFGKARADVMRAIDNLIQQGVCNFAETPWMQPQNGQTYRSFDMDRDGFALLAMGFTGTEALKFKLA